MNSHTKNVNKKNLEKQKIRVPVACHMLTENKNIINTNNAQQHHTVRGLAEESVSYVGDHATEDKHDTKNRDCEKMIIIVLQAVDDTDNTVG